jgi:uncharacterized protein YuzE
MKAWTESDWEEFDKLVATARSRYEQHAKGQRGKAPGAFQALDMIYNHLPHVNPTLAALVFGWIEGAFRRADLPEHEYDSEADAWYVHVKHDDVDHTTEELVNVDWTRDGKVVGIELLPGKPALVLKQNPDISDEELAAMKAKMEEAMKQPVMQRWIRESEQEVPTVELGNFLFEKEISQHYSDTDARTLKCFFVIKRRETPIEIEEVEEG